MLFGTNVIDFMWHIAIVSVEMAVFAAVLCSLKDLSA